MDSYPLAKALHVIGFVCWFAGLFYSVRLFIYRVEARERPEPERGILEAQLSLMTKRLWYGITWPSMVVTLAAGSWLLHQYGLFTLGWVHIKMTLVTSLVVYHLTCQRVYGQLAKSLSTWSSTKLRVWNEVATLLLVATVFIAVFKQAMDAVYGLLGFVLLGVVLMIAIRVYGRLRASSRS